MRSFVTYMKSCSANSGKTKGGGSAYIDNVMCLALSINVVG